MCQKSGKTLIPIGKPQVYFVDVVKCVNEVCSEMTHLALPTAWNARRPGEPAHLNSVRNLIPPTDRPTNRPRTLDRPSRAGVSMGWIEKWTEVQCQ